MNIMTQCIHNQIKHSALLTVKEYLLVEYKNFADTVRLIQQKRKTRKQLAELPEHLLKDVGLNHEDVHHEIKKLF